jgi:hypothetical protein
MPCSGEMIDTLGWGFSYVVQSLPVKGMMPIVSDAKVSKWIVSMWHVLHLPRHVFVFFCDQRQIVMTCFGAASFFVSEYNLLRQ